MDFDYKSYAFQHLESWIHDCMSSGDATSKEIYNTIHKVVSENYYYHKEQASQAYELLALLNGNGKGHIKSFDDCVDKVLSCDKDDPSPECKGAWNDFWEDVDDDIKEDIKEHGYDWTPVPSKNVPYPLYMNKNGDVCCPDAVVKKDKVVKWQLPVEVDGLTGDCYVNLPDDLLERAGLKEGDVVEWIDRGDGSFEMRKSNGPK